MPPAVDLARRYADALATLRAIHAFDAWLGSHWDERCPAPTAAPISYTPLGVAGSIAWYERGDTVIGVLPGQSGCFHIPRDAAMPDFLLAAPDAPPSIERDVVISAAMGEHPVMRDG